MSVGDVVIVYDLACAHCGSHEAAQLSKSLGLVFCNDMCLEAGLDEELRDEPLLTDAVQRFWNEEEQCYEIAASFSSFKRKVKRKAGSAKSKAKAAKRKAKKKAERAKDAAKRAKDAAKRKKEAARARARSAKAQGKSRAQQAKSKVKQGGRKAKRKAGSLSGPGSPGTPSGPGFGGGGVAPPPEPLPEDFTGVPPEELPEEPLLPEETETETVAEVFSLQYLLGKHQVEMDELDAEELYELKPFILAGEFGTFLLDFAISHLSSEQGYDGVAQSIMPELAQSHAQLLQTEAELSKIELSQDIAESSVQPISILIAGGSANGKNRAHWLNRLDSDLTLYFGKLALYWIILRMKKFDDEERRAFEDSLYGSYRTLLLTLGIVQGVYDETGLMDMLAEPLEALQRRIRMEATMKSRKSPSVAAQTKAKQVAAMLVKQDPSGKLTAGQSYGYDIESALLRVLDFITEGGRPTSPAPEETAKKIDQLSNEIASQLFEAFWHGS